MRKSRENISGSHPDGYSVPFPYVLAEFHLHVHHILIAVPAIIIATHGVRTSQGSHQPPRRIAVGQQGMELSGKYSAFPHPAIVTGGQFRTTESVVIPQKCRTETLVYAQIISFIGIRQEISRVVHQRKSRTDIGGAGIHPLPKLGFLKIPPIDIVETCHRPQIEVFAIRNIKSTFTCA